jgi:hypothetical protein
VAERDGRGTGGREDEAEGKGITQGFEGAVLDRDEDGRGMGAQEEWVVMLGTGMGGMNSAT